MMLGEAKCEYPVLMGYRHVTSVTLPVVPRTFWWRVSRIEFSFIIPESGDVVIDYFIEGEKVLRQYLGLRAAGTYRTTWDGRDCTGEYHGKPAVAKIYLKPMELPPVFTPDTGIGTIQCVAEYVNKTGRSIDDAQRYCGYSLPALYQGRRYVDYKDCLEQMFRETPLYLNINQIWNALDVCAGISEIPEEAEEPSRVEPPKEEVRKYNWLWLLPVALFIAARRD